MRVTYRKWKVSGLLGFALIVLATIIWLYTMAGGKLPGYDPFRVKAVVPDALNLVENADVRANGVKVGRIKSAEPKGQASQLSIEIDKKDQIKLYKNATVRVRTKTLVGESYLDINPGDAARGALPEGSVIPATQADEIVPLERILSTLDPTTRRNIKRNLRGVGGGLDGHGDDLNRLFAAMKPTVADAGRLMEALEPERRQLAILVDNFGQTMQAFGNRTQDLRGLIVSAKQTAEAVRTRDDALEDSFRELPATLAQGRATVTRLSDFAGTAQPVIGNLRAAAADLTPALRDLGPAATAGRRLFKELPPFLKQADPLLAELTPAAEALSTIMPPLTSSLGHLNPALRYLKPYAPEIASFFANQSKDFSGDKTSTVIRVHPMAGTSSFANESETVRRLIRLLIETGGVERFFDPRDNQYPAAGTVGSERSASGDYTHVEKDGS